jgi:hypothetical protein
MKIAIVCDWLVTVGGAEHVLRHLLECYPEADIFSVVDFLDDTNRAAILKNKKAKTTYIQHFRFSYFIITCYSKRCSHGSRSMPY